MKESIKVLEMTLSRLRQLYADEGTQPGIILKAGIKPGWNFIVGSRGQCGTAMNFGGWNCATPPVDTKKLRSYIGKDLFTVAADYLLSGNWQERSFAVAAMSALSQPLIHPDSLLKRGFDVPAPNPDFASLLRHDDVAAVVGYGGGVGRLLGKCKEIHVTDMRPREAFQTILVSDAGTSFSPGEVHVHPEKENSIALGKATAVLITGSSLVNGTFEELMGYATHARLVGMYGASVSIIPDVFFEMGVHYVHSYHVSDPEAFERGALNDMNMEPVIQNTQHQQSIRRKD